MRLKYILLPTVFSIGIILTSPSLHANPKETMPLPLQPGTLIAGYSQAGIPYMANMPDDGPQTVVVRNTQTHTFTPILSLVGPLTQQLLTQVILAGTDQDNLYRSYALYYTSPDSETESKPCAPSESSPTCVRINDVAATPLDAISLNSLIQPVVYTPIQQVQAYNVIRALQGTLKPIQAIEKIKDKGNGKEVRNYLTALRVYAATQTAALANLLQLYAERLPIDVDKQPDSSVKKALTTFQTTYGSPVSTLLLEQTMATRRIVDNKWYAQLSKDNPTALQRQAVELLAENLAESYKTRLSIERLNATMSILIIQLNAQLRTMVEQSITQLKK